MPAPCMHVSCPVFRSLRLLVQLPLACCAKRASKQAAFLCGGTFAPLHASLLLLGTPKAQATHKLAVICDASPATTSMQQPRWLYERPAGRLA